MVPWCLGTQGTRVTQATCKSQGTYWPNGSRRLHLGSNSGSKVLISLGADVDRHGGTEVLFNSNYSDQPSDLSRTVPVLVLKVSHPAKLLHLR